jgi:glycosyltransferase involved in cell wall biosynthesis
VGRLREKKGFPTLIAACQLLVQAGYQFQCDIVGYGPDKEALKQLIEHYQLSSTVRLLGKLTHNELVVLYRQATLFALPCQITDDGDRDGIPNVLMEAMTFAIPVVSTSISGIPELIVNNKTGLLVEPKNHQALFSAIQELLDNSELRKQLGEAGRQCVNTQFSAKQHIGRLKELLACQLQKRDPIRSCKPVTGAQHG